MPSKSLVRIIFCHYNILWHRVDLKRFQIAKIHLHVNTVAPSNPNMMEVTIICMYLHQILYNIMIF